MSSKRPFETRGMRVLASLIVAYMILGTLAVYGADNKRRLLVNVTKPLTTALLFPIIGWPDTRFRVIVWIAAALSLGGDVALLSDSNKAFIVGLGLFLLAYATYAVAFIGVGHASVWLVAFIAVAALSTTQLWRKLWPGAAGMRAPVVFYGLVISTMMVSAWATNGGALGATDARLASAGATLLYLSDSSLALDRFARPIPHAAILTMGVYWLGQLAIALAAR